MTIMQLRNFSFNFLTRFEAFLGHGRALESYLGGLKILIGLCVLPGWPINIAVLSDLQWFVPDFLIALPFLFVGFTQIFGLYLNAMGVEWSWILRAIAAFVAIFMWSWLLSKAILIGDFSSVIVPLAIMGIPASTFIFRKALKRLPVPGAAGIL